MDIGTILLCVVLLSLLAIAVVLFVRSSDEQKFNWFTAAHRPGIEYAAEYSRKEKLIKLGLHVLWLAPLFALLNYQVLPALNEPSGWACQDWFGRSAMLWVLELLISTPLLIMTVASIPVALHWKRVMRVKQHPLPGQKVFKPTAVIRGHKARARARLVLIVLPLCWLILLFMTVRLSHQLGEHLSPERVNDFCQPTSPQS